MYETYTVGNTIEARHCDVSRIYKQTVDDTTYCICTEKKFQKRKRNAETIKVRKKGRLTRDKRFRNDQNKTSSIKTKELY